MSNYEKIYVGKGQKTQNGLDIIRFTIKTDLIQEHIFQYQETNMITLEMSELKEPDAFGRTHTVYINKRVVVVAESETLTETETETETEDETEPPKKTTGKNAKGKGKK